MTQQETREYGFVQVDVFTDHMFGGNQLAVFPEAQGLNDQEMQSIAKEMNFAETTFVLPSSREDCVFRLRIFTPGTELPFAGHPNVGTGWVLATRGMLPRGTSSVRLDEGVGPIELTFEGDPGSPEIVWLRFPAPTLGPEMPHRQDFARALGLTADDLLDGAPILVGSSGVEGLYIPLASPEAVDRAALDVGFLKALPAEQNSLLVFVFAPDRRHGANRVYSRMFGYGVGIVEDAATGGATGPLGAYLVRHGLVGGEGEVRALSEQGTKMGRQSFLHIRMHVEGGEATSIEVGGGVVQVLTGTLTLPSA
jgi:trans-2,3-dihydro-3-hydroxyanthranilate isomerase